MANQEPRARVFSNHVWDDFRYVVHSRNEDTTYYVCVKYKSGQCCARGSEKGGVFNLTGRHTHLPNYRELKVRSFKRDLCRRVISQDDRFRQIYDATRPLHPEAAINAPFASCENSMYRWRRETWPPTPHSLSSYTNIFNSNEFEHWKRYNAGTITVSSVTDRDLCTSVIFIDVSFAREICFNNMVFLDATFKIVPANIGGYQFLTLMSIRYDHAFPFAWVLMERKREAAYVSVLQELRRIMPDIHITDAMTDYETALQNALRSQFPLINLHGCLFHYDQAVYKKLASLGLKRYVQQNEEARHIVRQIMALPLLPSNEITGAYAEIKDSMSLEARGIMKHFLKYFERQWLRIVKPDIFSVYKLLRRTNNVLESYHKTLQDRFGIHPNIWIFTRKLVQLQEGLRYDLASLQRGQRVSRLPKLTNVLKDQLIMEAWQSLNLLHRPTAAQFIEKIINISINPILEYLETHGVY